MLEGRPDDPDTEEFVRRELRSLSTDTPLVLPFYQPLEALPFFPALSPEPAKVVKLLTRP
jgi:hypothetical protein